MNFQLPNSEKGRAAVAYLSLLLVFWAVLLLLLGLDVWLSPSIWLYDTKWGQELLVIASLFLAVLAAHRIGGVSYFGVALVTLVGITGSLSYMLVRVSGPGYALQMLWDAWLELLKPVGVACIALLIIRQLTNLSSGQPPAAGTPDGVA